MAEQTRVRDDRYRRRFIEERERAERYRDLALAMATLLVGVKLEDFLDDDDLAEVARRRRDAHTGHRNG